MLLLLLFSISKQINPIQSDSLNIQESPGSSFWGRLEVGIGCSKGLCWAGKDLEEPTITSWDILAKFYWMNSVEGHLIYSINDNKKIIFGLEYGWSNLADRKRFSMYIPREEFIDTLYGDGFIKTCSRWNLSNRKIFIEYRFNHFAIGGSFNLCKSEVKENLYLEEIIFLESAYVSRWCWGVGLNLSYIYPIWMFKPFIEIELGFAREYRNNAPWEWEWDRKLNVSLSGINLGLIFEIGGK